MSNHIINNDTIVVMEEVFLKSLVLNGLVFNCVPLRYRPEEYKVLSTFPRRDVRNSIVNPSFSHVSVTLNANSFVFLS